MTQYETISAVAEDTRTTAQTLFYKVARLYVLYSVGVQLLQRADVFSPTDISDGKAGIQRLAERFDKLRPALEGGLQRLRDRLKDALSAVSPGAGVVVAPTLNYVLGVGIGTDPVTGT